MKESAAILPVPSCIQTPLHMRKDPTRSSLSFLAHAGEAEIFLMHAKVWRKRETVGDAHAVSFLLQLA